MQKPDLLPNCIPQRSEKTVMWANGMKWLPTFCGNCGKEGGMVLQSEWDRIKNFAFYLCVPCAEKWQPLVDTAVCPDEMFWRKIHDAQMEAFGRDLTEQEIIEALKDDEHILTKLCKDRHDLTLI